MKKIDSFWGSLEKYLDKIPTRSPISWQLVGIGVIVIAMILSLFGFRSSMVGVRSYREAITIAAERGDYALAEKLYLRSDDKVLGANAELENIVYPKLKVEKMIEILELELVEYPGDREIYLKLASLYEQLGNIEIVDEYREKARVLDPNNVSF